MPKGKKAESTTASKAEPAKVNKMEAVRQIIQTHGKETMPVEIVKFAKAEHKVTMSTDVASNYKSLALKKLGLGGVRKGKRGKKRGPKPAEATAVAVNGAKAAPKASTGGGIAVEDIAVVKSLVVRMGAAKVRELAEVLA